MAVSDAPLIFEERHSLYLVATEIPGFEYTISSDTLAWGQLCQIHAHVFLVTRRLSQGCRHRKYLREQCVIIMEEEQRRTRAGGSLAIAGNFTQEDINIRARLRVDIRNSAAILKTDLGSGALSGNDGPPKLDATQQRLEAAEALMSLSISTGQHELISYTDDEDSPERSTILQPRLLMDLAEFGRQGYFESASDLRKISRSNSHAVIDLTGEDDEGDACAGAESQLNGKRAHDNGEEGRVSVQNHMEGAKRRGRANARGAGQGKIIDGSGANDHALVEAMSDRLSRLDEDQKLVLLDAAFPSLDLAHIGRHLGNCYGDVTKAWEAINVGRFTIDHGSLPRNLAATAEINGNHEPAFGFLECFDSLLSPAGSRIMEYIKTASNAALERVRLLEMLDNERDILATGVKVQRLGQGELVALLQYAFPQYEEESKIAIETHVRRSPRELRGIWVGLERFSCEHRLRRPPFRFSESFSRPDSPLYKAPMKMLHARNIDHSNRVARVHQDVGEVRSDDLVRALGRVVTRVIIFEGVPMQGNMPAVPGVAPRMHDVMICQRGFCEVCGSTGGVENENVLQGRPFVHTLQLQKTVGGVRAVPEGVLIFAPLQCARQFSETVSKNVVAARVRFLSTGTSWAKVCVGEKCSECSSTAGGALRE
nr:hypothetical protein B0A51_00133 [Rachicladosporium sp. CCFEE 5018]